MLASWSADIAPRKASMTGSIATGTDIPEPPQVTIAGSEC